MHQEVKEILDYCFDNAKYLLTETADFDPFAAFIDNDGNLNPLEYDADKKSSPLSGDVIDSLLKCCKEEYNEGNIRGYGIAYEVSIQLEKDAPATDAIAIDIKHIFEKQIPLFYLPYQISNDEIVTFGDSFAVKRD